MPGFYETGKYDIAGFSLGIVDRRRIIDGKRVRAGDVLIGLASSGPHSNGYSLIRRLIPDLDQDFLGQPLGKTLLEPTRIYVKPILALLEQAEIHGMAHITGGGFYENIPRMFPRADASGGPRGPQDPRVGFAFDALLRDPFASARPLWTIPPIFGLLAWALQANNAPVPHAEAPGKIPDAAEAVSRGMEILKTDPVVRKIMFNTFNMGIGFVIAVPEKDKPRVIDLLGQYRIQAWEIGRVEPPALPLQGTLRFQGAEDTP
jgi:phosphoribosylformylglycinamidine cyclo-ligase